LQGSTTDEQSTQKQPAVFKLKVILKAAEKPLPTPISALQTSTIEIPS
jgi:hypothetical protein